MIFTRNRRTETPSYGKWPILQVSSSPRFVYFSELWLSISCKANSEEQEGHTIEFWVINWYTVVQPNEPMIWYSAMYQVGGRAYHLQRLWSAARSSEMTVNWADARYPCCNCCSLSSHLVLTHIIWIFSWINCNTWFKIYW